MGDRVGSWTEERIRWENLHPEWRPFAEDPDSQRRQNMKDEMG